MAERLSLYLDKKLGGGAENKCYLSENHDDQTCVIKIPNRFGRAWQTQGAEFLQRCMQALNELPVRSLQSKIHEDVELVYCDGRFSVKTAKTVVEQEYFPGLDEKTLDYGDLIDPEIGPRLMAVLIDLLHEAEEIRQRDELGLDLYGGAIIPEIFRGLFRRVILAITSLAPNTKAKIDGIRGQVRNAVLLNDEIVLTDNGFFDLSKNGKIRRLVLTAYNVCIAGSKKLLERLNERHGLPISPQRIEEIPYSGSRIEKWLGEFLLVKIMLPLYERHEQRISIT